MEILKEDIFYVVEVQYLLKTLTLCCVEESVKCNSHIKYQHQLQAYEDSIVDREFT